MFHERPKDHRADSARHAYRGDVSGSAADVAENRSFDHVFATHVPQPGQTVHNLLSEGIVALDANKNAIPGRNFAKAQQLAAADVGPNDSFLLSPPKQQFPNNMLPAPLTGGPEGVPGTGAYGYFTAGRERISIGAAARRSLSFSGDQPVFGKPIGHTLHAMSKPEFYRDYQHLVMSL